MGIFVSRLLATLFGDKEARILVLGLDNAGKTTILYRLQVGEVVSTIPTIGFNVETVQYNNIKFQVWDLGGQTSIRPYWRCYYPNTQAIIYVVDSSDTERMSVAQEEFHAILQEEELKDAVILIYANKQDLPGALDAAAVTEALNLHVIKNRQWSIFKTSAIKGDGLNQKAYLNLQKHFYVYMEGLKVDVFVVRRTTEPAPTQQIVRPSKNVAKRKRDGHAVL